MRKDVRNEVLLPLLVLLGLTLLFWVTRTDIIILKPFYNNTQEWFCGNNLFWILLHKCGSLPGILMGVASFIVVISGFFIKRYSVYRKAALLLILSLALGPGLITNALLKDHWGRPRPIQIKEFEGSEEYTKVWIKTDFKEGRSFPSGHAAIGFFLMTPFFVLRKTRRKWAVIFMLTGLIYGGLMGVGRMLQGAHFLSDVIWAAGIVYFSGLFLAYLFGFYREAKTE
jgi:membrane-associated PAP2 superfamily phosphatase